MTRRKKVLIGVGLIIGFLAFYTLLTELDREPERGNMGQPTIEDKVRLGKGG